jgi:DNA mismatch repair protein MutS
LYVPANAFAVRPYRALFTRILGNDDLHRGLSTFVVEMTELRTILRLSDENSLVLGDELCSGTETVSAISIFVAGIQSLYKSRCTFLFATHLHEIVQYDEIRALRDAVVLKHMTVTYDKERDILVYDRKLRDGSGPDMYGLEVCKALRLPADFLENAHQVRLAHHATIHRSVLDLTTSQYNARHLTKTPCSRCGERVAEEVHHLQPQENANDDGLIVVKGGAVFHKNHRANLTNLCAKCHDDVHRKPIKCLMTSALS